MRPGLSPSSCPCPSPHSGSHGGMGRPRTLPGRPSGLTLHEQDALCCASDPGSQPIGRTDVDARVLDRHIGDHEVPGAQDLDALYADGAAIYRETRGQSCGSAKCWGLQEAGWDGAASHPGGSRRPVAVGGLWRCIPALPFGAL